jgi:DNA (cytosine-5)-methyltransferase 1
MEAPVQALRNLGIDLDHVFASETNAACVRTIRANASPSVLFEGDIRKRRATDAPPVDLYVCGFPCQPFSRAGSQRGFEDERGTVFYACLSYIRERRPGCFVLENVRALLHHDGGRTWERILSRLREVGGYAVSWAVLNTKDYGVPQSRNRLYIVGLRDAESPFVFPPPVGPPPPTESVVDWADTSVPAPRGTFAARATAMTPALRERGACFVDVLQFRTTERIPRHGFPQATCVLCSSYVWCVPLLRWANTKELLRLQGFPDDYRIVVSEAEARKQIGNAMSVNVLQALLHHILPLIPRNGPGRPPRVTLPPRKRQRLV